MRSSSAGLFPVREGHPHRLVLAVGVRGLRGGIRHSFGRDRLRRGLEWWGLNPGTFGWGAIVRELIASWSLICHCGERSFLALDLSGFDHEAPTFARMFGARVCRVPLFGAGRRWISDSAVCGFVASRVRFEVWPG